MGVMITASHNPCGDNGMKIIDIGGEMLDSSWEQWCTHAANANDAARLTQILCECCEAFCISHDDMEKYIHHVTFFMGRDTRSSGNAILHAMKWVLADLYHVHCIDFGIVTTPQLHFYVNKAHDLCRQYKRVSGNANDTENNDIDTSTMEIQETASQLYNNTITVAFTKLLSFASTALCTEPCVTTDIVNVVQEENEAVTDKEVKCNISNKCTHVTSKDSNNNDIINISKNVVVVGTDAASASTRNKTIGSNVIHLLVDASNGVGSIALRHLFVHGANGNITTDAIMINKWKEEFILHIVNCHTESPNMLNDLCGADYAKFAGQPSCEMLNYQCDSNTASLTQECEYETEANDANTMQYTHFYCLDGDADRLIGFCRTECHQNVQINSYDENVKNTKYNINSNNDDDHSDEKTSKCTWHIIDGDQIAMLYATLLRTWLGPELLHELQVAIVQTAYANGATRKHIEDILHLRSIITATGVKHLHKAAKEVDIGIYFEANGHGTILINKERCHDVICCVTYLTEDEKNKKVEMLTVLSKLASQVFGDAIADMLLCEVVLKALQLTPNDIIVNWYDEFPAIQVKVRVPDPSVITTTADEQHALTPVGLQSAIDDAVRSIQQQFSTFTASDKHSNTKSIDTDNDKMLTNATKITVGTIHARAFVRPSGTEPIVRVYYEASRQDACEELYKCLSRLIVKIVI